MYSPAAAASETVLPDDVRLNQTYAHAFARLWVRPLLGTWVRPNHLTLLRMVLGLAACTALVPGTLTGALWSGILWFVACVLDRADGELARIGNMRSASGAILDFYTDMILDSFWFLGAGFALSHTSLGSAAIALGAVTCTAMVGCIALAEWFERMSGPGVKAVYGHQRFHPDDALFLLALFPLLGWLKPVLLAAGVCTPVIAGVLAVRCWQVRRLGTSVGRFGR